MTIRSRASGGICGDSRAADSAATMSSLRRRAIWVTRARSIARSSTGGRARARTTAPASPGSTSSRSHASRSRTSARWKNAAAPDRWYGTARSSKATATAWPSARTERTSTQTSSGATSPREISRSTSAATACACARSDAQRQNATSPPGAPGVATSVLSSRSSIGATTAPDAASSRAPRAQRLVEPHDRRQRPLGAEVADVLGRGAAEAVDRLVVVGERGDPAVLGHQQPQQQALGEAGVLQLVDQHVRVARRQPRAHVRLLAQQPERVQDEVADVERAGVAQQPVVGGEQLGELALARAARVVGQRRRPRAVVRGADQLVLEPVDPADDRAERGARVAAQVVVAQRQVVDALEQHRQPVGGGDRRRERVQPRLQRLVAQQPRAQARERRHRQLLVGHGHPVLDPLAQAIRGVRRRASAPGRPPATNARRATRSARRRPSSSRCRHRRGRAAGRRRARRPRAGRRSAQAPP